MDDQSSTTDTAALDTLSAGATDTATDTAGTDTLSASSAPATEMAAEPTADPEPTPEPVAEVSAITVPAPVADLSFHPDQVVREDYKNDAIMPDGSAAVAVRLTLADGRYAYGGVPATGDLMADQAAAKASAAIEA